MWTSMSEEREWMRDDFQRDDSNKLQQAYDQGYEDGYRKAMKEEVEEIMKQYNIKLKNDVGYDAVYVFNMAMADYYGSSIPDKQHVAMFVRDYLDDPDGTPTRALDEYVGRCIGAGTPVMWEDVL